MLIIAPIYKVKPLKDVKLFPYVRISRNLALVSASRQEINQAFDHFYAKYIEDESTIFSSKIKLPFEKFKFLSKASIRFDNKLFIFRKPEPAEKIKSIKENKTLYVAALGVSNS